MSSKQFLITGASSGIGLALAQLVLSKGHKVIGVAIDKSAINHDKYQHHVVDQSQPRQIINLFHHLQSSQVVIDGLAVNAGIIPRPCGIEDITEESVNRVTDTNLKGTFYNLKYLGQLVRPATGSIVVTSSVDGLIGEPYAVMYSATKAGIISLMQSFARHYGAQGIRVNAVSPGLIDTPLTSSSGELESDTTDFSIFKRMGIPTEVAEGMYFLLSSHSTFVTGQNLVIDGGFVLK